MQNAAQNSLLKEAAKYLGWVLLFVALWFRGCEATPTPVTAKVIVPEVKGKFAPIKPNHTNVKGPEKDQEKPVIQWKDKIITIENPLNIDLANKYIMAKDSIERLNLYLKSIELKKFSSHFDDEFLTLNIDGIVQGEVQEITPSYTIKKREIQVKPKETVFRVLGGLEVGNNVNLDNFAVKGNLLFQNKKGNLFSGSFDTNQTIWIGYNASIFSIKK